jgi:Family of unknown function (DUF6328)
MLTKPAQYEQQSQHQPKQEDQDQQQNGQDDDQDMSDLLQEIRVVQQGAQVLTAFLTILPFSEGFATIDQLEKWVYLATFVSSISALVFFSAPAAQHRLARPLHNRPRFKDFATRMVIIGLVPLSLALVLSTQLVVSQVFGLTESLIVSAAVALLIAVIWWLVPLARKGEY